MADNAAASSQQEDELCLPRAAVNKMIKEMIPMIRISNDARELVLNCCTEFIHLIASEANEICNKQTKKTISPEHVISALQSLGFQDYVRDVEGVYQQFKTQAQTRKKNNKLKNQGVSEEELLRQQQALFAQARAEQAQEEWMMQQQQQQNITQQQQNITQQLNPSIPTIPSGHQPESFRQPTIVSNPQHHANHNQSNLNIQTTENRTSDNVMTSSNTSWNTSSNIQHGFHNAPNNSLTARNTTNELVNT